MDKNIIKLVKQFSAVYLFLIFVFAAEFAMDLQNPSLVNPKLIFKNQLTTSFPLFVRDYNLWKFNSGRMYASENTQNKLR